MKANLRLWMLATLGAAGCAAGEAADLGDGLGPVPRRDGGTASQFEVAGDGGLDAAEPAVSTPEGGAQEGGLVVADAGRDATIDPCSFAGTLLSFDLTKLVGTTMSIAPSSKAAGVSGGALVGVGVTATASSGAINRSNWSMGAVDTGKYYTFSVTPPAGCRMTLTTLAIDLKASGTGPEDAAVATSADGYVARAGVGVTAAGGAVNVALAGVSGVAAPVEIRVFGFNATSAAGTLRIEGTMSITGALAAL